VGTMTGAGVWEKSYRAMIEYLVLHYSAVGQQAMETAASAYADEQRRRARANQDGQDPRGYLASGSWVRL
jgi:hypothetical protein